MQKIFQKVEEQFLKIQKLQGEEEENFIRKYGNKSNYTDKELLIYEEILRCLFSK